MFKTVEELKEFITWAKSQRIKTAKIGDVHFELSELAYMSDLTTETPELVQSLEKTEQEEDEEALFWSADRT